MTETVKVQQAKTQLSALLSRVQGGESFVIARDQTPVARLVPLDAPESAPRELGFVPYRAPDSAWDALGEDELDLWEN